MFFCDWLLSLSFENLNIFKVHPCPMSIPHVFSLLSDIPLNGYSVTRSSIYQLMDIRLVSTFCGKVAMNICVQAFVWVYMFISLWYLPWTSTAGSVSGSMFYLL